MVSRNQIMDTVFTAWKTFEKAINVTAVQVFAAYTGPTPFVVKIRCDGGAFSISDAQAGTYVTVPTQTWFEIRAGNVANTLWVKAAGPLTLSVMVEGNT